MVKIKRLNPPETIEERAAHWAVRMDGRLTSEERQQLDVWLAADSRHRGAYARALAYSVHLERFAAFNAPAEATPIHAGIMGIGRRHLLAAGAAGAFLGGAASWWLLPRGGNRTGPSVEHYSTRVGEIRRVALADGSVLSLNTASTAVVRFNEREREVQLLRGEALFDVAHDPRRQFVVTVKKAAARAIGTAFTLRLKSDQIDLTVTEGVVELGRLESVDGNLGLPLARVSAFQQAIVRGDDRIEVQPIRPADAERILGWQDGVVSFDGQSLQAAVSELNRYNQRRIIVDDPDLAQKPIVGVFGVTELDGFTAAIAAAFKAKVVVEDGVIHIRRDPAAKK